MLRLLSPLAFFFLSSSHPYQPPSSIPALFPNWWVWFCSVTHSVTKVIYRTIGLELFTGIQGGQRWVHHWRQWLSISLSFSVANMSAARVGHLELLLTHAWLLENLFLYRPIIFCLPIYPSSTQLACAHPLRLLWSNNTALRWCWEGEGDPNLY